MHKIVSALPAVCLLALGAGTAGFSMPANADEARTQQPATLYERLGGQKAIQRLVKDIITYHRKNPQISHYFKNVDTGKLAVHVEAFFAMGTGGPAQYAGRDMTTTHAGMGLTNADFDAAIADILRAMNRNRVDEQEQAEVVAILQSLRPAVMARTAVAGTL